MVEVGKFVAIRYDVPGEHVFHERLVPAISPRGDGVCATLTPDGDHYIEQLTLEDEDLAAIRSIAHSGDTPPWGRSTTYV